MLPERVLNDVLSLTEILSLCSQTWLHKLGDETSYKPQIWRSALDAHTLNEPLLCVGISSEMVDSIVRVCSALEATRDNLMLSQMRCVLITRSNVPCLYIHLGEQDMSKESRRCFCIAVDLNRFEPAIQKHIEETSWSRKLAGLGETVLLCASGFALAGMLLAKTGPVAAVFSVFYKNNNLSTNAK